MIRLIQMHIILYLNGFVFFKLQDVYLCSLYDQTDSNRLTNHGCLLGVQGGNFCPYFEQIMSLIYDYNGIPQGDHLYAIMLFYYDQIEICKS